MKELVELIAKALVDNPDRVVVSQLEGEQTMILELKVAPEDLAGNPFVFQAPAIKATSG